MWKRKSVEQLDAYSIAIVSQGDLSPFEWQEIVDKPGRESCDSFQRVPLERSEQDGLPSVFWRTECYKGDVLEAQIIQLVIAGNDSLYHVQKIWRGRVSSTDRDEWIARLATVYVCDTRPGKRACPKGFRRVSPGA